MLKFFYWSRVQATLLTIGITLGAFSPIIISAPVEAQVPAPTTTPSQTPTATTNFPDVGQDYWASPFIQALAQRNVITGFPDGSFKPEQPVSRAEFAAMIQKAFNPNPVRQLPQGGFRDVSSNYWAASAITAAYESGFMSGFPGNSFQPNQRISKVQAVVALTNGLALSGGDTATLTSYYTDANTIPSYAVDKVAAATQANLVVNYPDVKVLNSEAPLTRAEAAAHLYQALVKQGQLQPLASNLPAANYIVGRTAGGTQTGGTQTGGDIVSVAGASNSFTTLTSLLRTAGLADSLQQAGPYTIFAPTDQAFAALPPETLQRLQQPENREALIKVLTYHVVAGQLTANQLKAGDLNTAEGRPVNVKVNTDGTQIGVNNAEVIQPNIQASNGVIHAINQVLIPPNLSFAGGQSQAQTSDIDPGRATRGGRSYVGVAGNIGLTGDTALSDTNFTVISKLGLTRNISVRPSAVFGDDTIVLVPLTYDLSPRATNAVGETFSISPYIGAGVAIDTRNDVDLGLLLTGGVDVPLGTRFTLTGAVNAAFLNSTDVGLLLGVGYNF
jgi:uncharacterized surface protein with fasciclin (FAS1) repeats